MDLSFEEESTVVDEDIFSQKLSSLSVCSNFMCISYIRMLIHCGMSNRIGGLSRSTHLNSRTPILTTDPLPKRKEQKSYNSRPKLTSPEERGLFQNSMLK